MRNLIRGATAYVAVLPLFTKLGLWKYVALTVGVALLVLLLTLALVFTFLYEALETFSSSVSGGLQQVLWAVLCLATVALLFKRIVLVATAPWMGTVAERVYARVGTLHEHPHASAYQLIARSFRLNVRLLVLELLCSVPLVLLSLVPIANLAAVLGLFLVQSYFVGAGVLDYSLEQRYDYRQSLHYLKGHRGLATGVGAGFVGLLLLGIGFLIAPAWSAAAGAWAFAKTEHTEGLERVNPG